MRDHLLNEIEKLLWMHFPNDSSASDTIFWQLEPFRSSWFQLASRANGIVDSADLLKYIREDWFQKRKHALRKSHRLNLEKLVEAWHEWQFAIAHLTRSSISPTATEISSSTTKQPEVKIHRIDSKSSETSSLASELKAIQAENARLKILLAETILDQSEVRSL